MKIFLFLFLFLFAPVTPVSKLAFAMHISEGILPLQWALLWYVLAIPFVYLGLRELRARTKQTPYYKPLLGLVGAAVFVISCLPIPVPTAGTCSHPAGTGLAAIFIGPAATVFVTSIALTLQALFLAHGGLTTLGADVMSMGVAGAFAGYGAFRLSQKLGAHLTISAFLAGLVSDWATYAVTSFELASALFGDGSFWAMFAAICAAFVPTQLPLGIFEGFLSALAYRFVSTRRPELISLFAKGAPARPGPTG